MPKFKYKTLDARGRYRYVYEPRPRARPFAYSRDAYGIVTLQSRRTGRVMEFGTGGGELTSSRNVPMTAASIGRVRRLMVAAGRGAQTHWWNF